EEEREAPGGGQRDGGGRGGGDQDRQRVRRARHDGDLAEREERAGAGDAVGAGQPAQQQVEGLREGVFVAVQAGAEDLQVDPGAAARDAQVETAAGERVEQNRLLGQGDRMAGGEDAGG